MKVSTAHDGPSIVVRLAGRLDGEGGEQLSEILDAQLREGVRSVVLDMEDVAYASSAGMQALARWQHEFGVLRAELRVRYASPAVINALTQADLRERLMAPGAAEPEERGLADTATWRVPSGGTSTWDRSTALADSGLYDVAVRQADAVLRCEVIGSPGRLTASPVTPRDLATASFPEDAFGLGIGALGLSAEDGIARLGELVAAGGSAIHLPTEGGRVPDFQLSGGGRVPLARLATGIVCRGPFARMVRFSTLPDRDAVPLSELAGVCLDISAADVAGIVMLTEVRGLVGAWLLRSPGGTTRRISYDVPEVREWFGFTPERSHPESTALVVGVVARRAPPDLAPHLRPLGGNAQLVGHFHAVAMTYRPIPQRTVALAPLLSRLLRQQRIRGVLHLNTDPRPAGAGQSQFRRGLCWTGPIPEVEGLA
ncbi:MAG: STAS domain-containing protein [Gemmatimonadota bacterium]